ncbi:MAG: transglutaminase domain-containing protein [Planctomycetes bacterium]|nr:transglutaminase domain-containing protein [Planctomycetota bacterium]
MKAKFILGICLVLAAVTATGCRKKTPAPQGQSMQQMESSEQFATEQAASDKSVTEEPMAVKLAQQVEEPVSVEAGYEQAQPEETEYFAVFMEGKKIGYAIQNRVVADGQVITSEKVRMTISRAGVSITIEMTETSIETTEGTPVGFEVVQQLGAMMMKVSGKVDEEGNVNLTTTSMGAEEKSTLEWPGGAVMAEGLRLLELKNGLKEGTEYSVKIFSPGILQAVDAQIRIGSKQNVDLLGRVVTLTGVMTTLNMPGAGPIVSTSYVDDDFRMQKTITSIAMMRIEMIACAKEFALGQNDVLELIDKMFLASPEPLNNVGSVRSITYHLSPVEETDSFLIPSNDNQRVRELRDGTKIVTVEPVAASAGVRFPYRGGNETILAATRPTRFLQSNRKEIIDLARRAVGRTKDAAEAVRRIEAFVAEYVENRSLSVGYASAAEVAASRQGDCSEFAVLTAAMCRAVGIPAQMVVGVAYVEDFAGFQGFGGHAWVQAYVGGKWVGLDAAFKAAGRGGYDAGHIALASGNGEPADFFNLASTLGRFKIEKVIVEKR